MCIYRSLLDVFLNVEYEITFVDSHVKLLHVGSWKVLDLTPSNALIGIYVKLKVLFLFRRSASCSFLFILTSDWS